MRNTIKDNLQNLPVYLKFALGILFLSTCLVLTSHFADTAFPNHISIGDLKFNFYGMLIAGGCIAAAWFVRQHLLAKGVITESLPFWDWLIAILFAGIAGARLFHVISDWQTLYATRPLDAFAIWDGGLSFFGGLIGGILVIIYFCYKYGIALSLLLNHIVLFVPIGQMIGRFGNFFNQELFGFPSDNIFGIYIDPRHRPTQFIASSYFHPVFFYEQIGNTLILFVLWYLSDRNSKSLAVIKNNLLFVYLALYSIVRLIVEQFRLDPAWVAGLSFGEVLSLAVLMVSLLVLVYKNYRASND